MDESTSILLNQHTNQLQRVEEDVFRLKENTNILKIDGIPLSHLSSGSTQDLITTHNFPRQESLENFIKNMSNDDIKDYLCDDNSDIIILRFLLQTIEAHSEKGTLHLLLEQTKDNWGKPLKRIMMQGKLSK